MATVSSNKISKSGDVIFGLIVLLISIFIVILVLIWAIFDVFFLYPTTALVIVAAIPLVFTCTGRVAMNQAAILLNSFSKKARAIFHGLYIKLPWEKVEYERDLESAIKSEVIAESFPTQSGTVIASASILSKVDSAEGQDEITRSQYMIENVKYESEVGKEMLVRHAKELMRQFFHDKTLIQALAADGKAILKPENFNELAEELRIVVKECPVFDIDPTEATQSALDARTKAEIIKEIADEFQKLDPTLSGKDALDFASLMDKDISVEKKIQDFNVHGLSVNVSPAVAKVFSVLATKLIKYFGGKS